MMMTLFKHSLHRLIILIFSLSLFTKASLAGEFGCGGLATCNVWVTDGYFYNNIKAEIEQAWFDDFYDPNGRTFGGSPELFFLHSVRSSWFTAQNGGPFIDHMELVYINENNDAFRVVDPGQFVIDNFACPPGKHNEANPNLFTVNQEDRYCTESPSAEKEAGPAKPKICVMTDWPIHLATGNKFLQETDYQSSTPGGLSFRRYFNTQGRELLRIGQNWLADFHQNVRPVPEIGVVEVRRPGGNVLEYREVNGQWVGDTDVVELLEEVTDGQGTTTGWQLTLPDDTVEEFRTVGSNAVLSAIIQRNGLTTTVVTDLPVAQGGDTGIRTPDIVTDPFGRTLQFKYDATTGNLITMIDPDGNETYYTHDVDRKLISVSYPDDTPLDPNDNPMRTYHYEDTNFPGFVTGITDETSNRLSNYAYDTEGRAIMSELAGGAERVDVIYNPNGTTTVTEANGNVSVYTFDILQGTSKVGSIAGDTCPTCGGQVQAATYDTNGFLASQTDFNGNQTTFINNSRGLETSRTEAVGTAEERTITTEWHPTYRLPTKITEPGQETTFTYDTQGNLLTRTVEEVTP